MLFITNNSIKYLSLVYIRFNNQTVLFQTIQFIIIHLFSRFKCHSSIWLIDRAQSGCTTRRLSGPGSDGNEVVLRILQNSRISEASPSDCFVSYAEHSLGAVYLSVEIQLVYSATPADWASVGVYIYYVCYIYVVYFM